MGCYVIFIVVVNFGIDIPYSALSNCNDCLPPPLIVYLVVDHLLLMQERRPIAINSVPSYLSWLQDWNEYMQEAPVSVLVPLQACQICTPLIVGNWSRALQSYPFQPLSKFFPLGYLVRLSHWL